MEVQIDNETIARAVAEIVERGIADGVGSWETRRQIDEAVKECIERAELPRLIHEALDEALAEQAEEVAKLVVEEAGPALREGMRAVLAQSMQAMIYGLLAGKPNSYSTEETALWNQAGKMLDPVVHEGE